MIRSIPTLFVIIFLVSCNTPKTNETTTSSLISENDREALKELMTLSWPKAYADQDTALLDQLLHEKFQLVDDQGETFGKKDELTYVKKYGPSYDSFVFEITRLDLFDNGTAVVTGMGTLTGSDADGNYVTTYRSSNVLVKEEGRWQSINNHVSGVKEEREGA